MGRMKIQKKKPGSYKNSKLSKNEDVDVNDMDDEIDAFHKKRDMIPLDINADSEDSEEDDQQHVLNVEGTDDDNDEDDEFDDEDDEFDDDDDDGDNDEEQLYEKRPPSKREISKIERTLKFMKEKTGGGDDEILDDGEEEEDDGESWSFSKRELCGVDESGDEDPLAEEEEEVIRMMKQRAKALRPEDFGIQEDEDDSDVEPTLEERMGKDTKMSSRDIESGGGAFALYEEVKKDINALSKDEQMNVVYSSAPELVGLLSELNDAFNELETRVNPLLCKVRKGKSAKKEGLHYLEVKLLLLQAYCQAIVFYLLLKSEGQLVRDHPVIARLVELKSLVEKMKELDRFIPDDFEDALNDKDATAGALEQATTDSVKQAAKAAASLSNLYTELNNLTGLAERKAAPQTTDFKEEKQKKRKLENISSESVQMLKHRAALEDKLKLKSVSDSDSLRTVGRTKKKLKTLAGNLETTDDFDDDPVEMGATTLNNGRASTLSSKLSRIIPAKNKKGVAGDDDLPERDNLGERRWKHELRVLERAGVKSNNDYDQPESDPESLGDDGSDDDDDGGGVGDDGKGGDSGKDFFSLIKHQRELKLKMKAAKYSRNPQDSYIPDDTVEGKRYINAMIEKNRGLTRNRKKEKKNPRKKRRMQYEKALIRRKGMVQEMKKPSGPYGGEATGINAKVTKSRRL